MKKRFNWIDVLIVILIIGIGYFSYVYFLSPKTSTTVEKLPAKITYRVDGVLQESVNGLKIGDIFQEKDTNQVIGEVVEKEIEDFYDLVETGDGKIIKSKVPNRYTLYITIEGQAVITNDYIRMGGKDMRIEGTIFLKSDISSFKSVVTNIDILE